MFGQKLVRKDNGRFAALVKELARVLLESVIICKPLTMLMPIISSRFIGM